MSLQTSGRFSARPQLISSKPSTSARRAGARLPSGAVTPLVALGALIFCGWLMMGEIASLFSDHAFAEDFDRAELQTMAPRDVTSLIERMTHFDVDLAAMAPLPQQRTPLAGVACARSKSGAYAFWEVLTQHGKVSALVPKTRFSHGDFSLISSSCWFLLNKL